MEDILQFHDRPDQPFPRMPEIGIGLTNLEQKLVDLIGWEPMPMDTLISDSGLPLGELTQALLQLQIK